MLKKFGILDQKIAMIQIHYIVIFLGSLLHVVGKFVENTENRMTIV